MKLYLFTTEDNTQEYVVFALEDDPQEFCKPGFKLVRSVTVPPEFENRLISFPADTALMAE